MINRENIKLQKQLKGIPDNLEIQEQIKSIQKKLNSITDVPNNKFEISYLNSEIDRLLLKEIGVEVFVNLIDEKQISNLDEQLIKEKQEQLIREIQNI